MTASNYGLIMNIVNSIVGVSVLTMPFCFRQCGIVLGTILLFVCTWMTHQSCLFLVKTACLTKRRTYAGLAFHAYGKTGKTLVETSMIGLMLGTCIAFYVVIADLGSNFFARLLGLEVTEGFRVLLLIFISLCIVLPLSLQRNIMSSIQSFSAMALIFYTFFMFVIVVSSFNHGVISGQWLKMVSYFRWEGIFRCIPIFGMSFACQSQVLPTYDSLDEPSVKIMSSIFASSLNVVTAFYITVGFFGYISFPENIAGNVLMNFPSNLVTEMIRVGFMMSVAVGFPMMILPCRQALNTLLFEQQQKDGTFAAGGYMPPLRFKVITLSVVFGTMLGGILIPNVETILGLTGATMGSLICFICPALIYKKIHKNGLSSQVVLWIGLAILVISTFSTLSVTTEPAKIEPLLPEQQEKNVEKVEPQQPTMAGQNPEVKEPVDERDKPKLGNDKEAVVEQPQIKVPVEVPKAEEKQKEEVQLDRPGQDVAHPIGEAHRHEPPVPHDQVIVDEVQDKEELEEGRLPPAKQEIDKDNILGDRPADNNAEQKLDNEEKKQEAPVENVNDDQVKEKPDRPDEEAEKPLDSDLKQGAFQPHKDLELPKKAEVLEPDHNVEELLGKPVIKEDGIIGGGQEEIRNPPENIDENIKQEEKVIDGAAQHVGENGEKKALPEEKMDLQPVVQEQQQQQQELPEKRAERNADGVKDEIPDSKLEDEIKKLVAEAGKAEMLDHAVLLQVIKEQQEQQKRLLDQQEKLLAVIQEQHKEIHQQEKVPDVKENMNEDVNAEDAADSVNHNVLPKADLELNRQPDDAAVKQELSKKKLNNAGHIIEVGNPQNGPDSVGKQVIQGDSRKNEPLVHNKAVPEDEALKAGSKPQYLGEEVKQPSAAESPDEVKSVLEKLSESQQNNVQHAQAVAKPHIVEKDTHKPRLKIQKPEVGVEKVLEQGSKNEQRDVHRQQVPVMQVQDNKIDKGVDRVQAKSSEHLKIDIPKNEQSQERGGVPNQRADNEMVNLAHKQVMNVQKESRAGGQVENKHDLQNQVMKENDAIVAGVKQEENNLDVKKPVEKSAGDTLNKLELSLNRRNGDVKPQQAGEAEKVDKILEDDSSKQNKDPKGDTELRRRKRDLALVLEAQNEQDTHLYGLNPVPNLKTDDLRSALEAHLNQAAEGAQSFIQSRQLMQITDPDKEA
ncbi:putative sodium-coupled neutral amino acid transporter 10 [Protopterus annectens]|uniref:putative sodium-coupled neutral amino acid transporter 10 n=1 Tax=Protopterus annectens TaxID=7888 RepID=UPI001CFBCF11|nr:putative sodium-coupled neutral amino acid transporter 10 [Protopterus annectens]